MEIWLFGLGLGVLVVSVFLKAWPVPLAAMFLFLGAMMQPDIDTWFQWSAIVLTLASFVWSVLAFWKGVAR